MGDGLRAWHLWSLGLDGRAAVVRLLQGLEQAVERIGGPRDGGLALLGELYAAEQVLRATIDELAALAHLPAAAVTLAQLTSAVERLHSARGRKRGASIIISSRRLSMPSRRFFPRHLTNFRGGGVRRWKGFFKYAAAAGLLVVFGCTASAESANLFAPGARQRRIYFRCLESEAADSETPTLR